MNKIIATTNKVKYIKGDQLDREKWDRCLVNAVNGNICTYSWFLDIMCNGWDGLVAGDYVYIMPVSVSRRFGIDYLLQPRFIQQSGVFGTPSPDIQTVGEFIEGIPKNIKVLDYHFNDQNTLAGGWDVEIRPNFLLKTDKSYEELKLAYSKNLKRNLKKSMHSGFHIIKSRNPEPLIQLFREESGSRFSFINDENYSRLSRVIHACLRHDMAEVWNVYNRENEICAGIVWLFSHGKAVLYFSAQSKLGRSDEALAWLIDAFICEHASSGIILDFEGSVQQGLGRFYSSFGAVLQPYPRFTINKLSPLFKLFYLFYRKMKKD
jgi:hypothetical protein